MAACADHRPASEHRAHVDHGARAHACADVEDGAHHDDRALSDLDLLANDGARLDPGVQPLRVQHGNGGIAAGALDHDIGNGVLLRLDGGADVPPVAKYDFCPVPGRKDLGVRKARRKTLPNVDLDWRFLFGSADIFDQFRCVHVCAPFHAYLL